MNIMHPGALSPTDRKPSRLAALEKARELWKFLCGCSFAAVADGGPSGLRGSVRMRPAQSFLPARSDKIKAYFASGLGSGILVSQILVYLHHFLAKVAV
jgi:hypothetical protein